MEQHCETQADVVDSMEKPGFCLGLAELPKGCSLIGLDFYLLDEQDGYDPVIGSIPQANYGELFAYLFRRFGYPIHGWDSYKDLVKYILTTPRQDMWLRIIPYPGSNDLTFSFMVMASTSFSMRDWERADINAWEARRLDWYIEHNGWPEWAESLCLQVAREFGARAPIPFKDAAPYLEMLCPRNGEEPKTKWAATAKVFFDSMKPFEDEHVRPGFRKRSRCIDDWRDDDPLKDYAQAAVVALCDLKRPVRVRDWAITAFGDCDDPVNALDEPPVAGYAAGALLRINEDPKSAIAANRLIEENGGLAWIKKMAAGA
jgi:hypothetical protein